MTKQNHTKYVYFSFFNPLKVTGELEIESLGWVHGGEQGGDELAMGRNRYHSTRLPFEIMHDMITSDLECPSHDYIYITSRHRCWFRKFTARFRPIRKEVVSSMYINLLKPPKCNRPSMNINKKTFVFKVKKPYARSNSQMFNTQSLLPVTRTRQRDQANKIACQFNQKILVFFFSDSVRLRYNRIKWKYTVQREPVSSCVVFLSRRFAQVWDLARVWEAGWMKS